MFDLIKKKLNFTLNIEPLISSDNQGFYQVKHPQWWQPLFSNSTLKQPVITSRGYLILPNN